MYLVGILLAASTVSRAAYEVSTHRAMGYWAIQRSSTLNPALNRLEWDLPETKFGGPRLTALNSDLALVREVSVSNPRAPDLIAAGCATEDAHSTWSPSTWRFLNHFLDGVTFQGLFGGLGGEPSDTWATTEPSNIFNWELARSHFVSSLVDQDPDDREAHRVDLFRSLGQVLHLIQDAHQPSHTRDDSHSNHVLVPDGYSALELWAGQSVTLDGASLDPVVAAFVNSASATYRNRIADYIRLSASRTNREFYSDDTIWQDFVLFPPYAQPNGSQTYLANEGIWPFEETYVLAYQSLHNTIPPLKMARQRSGLIGLVDPLDPRVYTLESPDDDIVRSHAAILTQRAVSECAGAINHFFRLAIEADIDTTTQPGEGRLKLTNISSVPGASPTDLTVSSGATLLVRYETVSGQVLPIPNASLPSLPGLAPGASVTLPFDILGSLQPLADPVNYPNPDVRARTDLKFVVVVQGVVGAEQGVGGDVWSRKCPNNFPTPAGMVAIQSGTFTQGSNAPDGPPYYGQFDDPVVRQVTISYCYWMGETEVTQAQYAALMGTNPSYFPGANNPVEQVTWFNAQAYCAALTAQQSALGNVPPGYQYRLPTEAEWEYACRAGTTTEFNVGSALFCNQAKFWYSYHSNSGCNSNSTVPVGSYAPNAWGLHDMHGNVWEWCLDSYAAYSAGALTDPFVTGGPYRVVRGGSWDSYSYDCRSAYRINYNPGFTNVSIGFRVVLAPVLVP